MFKALGAFFGRMFGTEKAMESAVDSLSRGLDKLVYTKEEKAEVLAAAVSEARQYLIQWMDKTQGQNLARRFLATVITFTWLSMFLFSTALDLAVIWVIDEAINSNIRGSSVLIGARAESMTGAMMLILGFYFAAPHLDKIVGPALSRFGGGK